MTLTDFAKNMRKIRTGRPATHRNRTRKPIEIIDDVVSISDTMDGWNKTERNGRIYLTRL